MEPWTHGISREEARRLYGNRSLMLGRLRVALACAQTLAILYFARPTPLRLAVGLPFILGGEALHTWAHGHLRKTLELVTSGPYAYTQNPLYLGRLLMAIGLLIAAGLSPVATAVLGVLVAVVFFGYYMPRKTGVEGRRLRGFHGATWEEYHRSVPRLVPSFSRYAKASDRRFSLSVLRGNREQFVYLALLASLAVLAFKAFRPS